MHDAVADYCRAWATTGPGTGLDLGGRDLNGHPRDLWPGVRWLVLDLRPGPGVDVVADATVDQDHGVYDVVLCTEVLEHVEDWPAVVATSARALAAGGRLVITCAGPGRAPHSGITAAGITPGEWYRNVSHHELAAVLVEHGLMVDDCRQAGLDTQAAAHRPEVTDG